MNEKLIYIVATPIGNLADITLRAIDTLKQADMILCEDTRVTKKLLDHYQIKKPLLSYHQRSAFSRVNEIIELLEKGTVLALVTDAGTPGVSDPGSELVNRLIKHFEENLKVTTIPGVSAFTALIQVAGINLSKFAFLGFPPNKKGRETFFKQALEYIQPVIYYESPYRLLKNLQLLRQLDAGKLKNLVVGRELTKYFEEVKRGTIEEIIEYYNLHPDKVKGEFVVIIY